MAAPHSYDIHASSVPAKSIAQPDNSIADAAEPGEREVVAIQVLALAAVVVAIHLLGGYWQRIPDYQDNPFHSAITRAILHWDFASRHGISGVIPTPWRSSRDLPA